ncbi:MAG: hypothetical protein ABIG08_01935 [bacterium]
MLKKTIIIFALIGLFFSCFSFAQSEPQIKAPETVEDAKELGEKAVDVSKEELPGIVERIWKEEVLPVWQKMRDWFKNIWLKVENWFEKHVYSWVKEKIEKKKPEIQQEFQKEKEELKEEAPKVGKSLWEKFKDLIR